MKSPLAARGVPSFGSTATRPMAAVRPELISPSALLAWQRATLEVASSRSLLELQQSGLAGVLDVTLAPAGAILFFDDETENLAIPSRLVMPAGIHYDSAWRGFPIEHDGASFGLLQVDWVPSLDPLVPWVEFLCEHIAAAAARTRQFDQLQTIKREWQAMLDGMLDGVYVCDEFGIVLRANRTLAAMLGAEIARLIGRKRDELLAELPDFSVIRQRKPLEVGPAHLAPQVTEFQIGRPERIYVETSFELGQQDPRGRRRLLCVLHDVTESRRLQEQLLQSEKLVALGELTSGVAHELNNPLATVVGYAELLESETNIPESLRRKVSTIHSEALRASHIVQNLLSYARRSSPERNFVNINEVLGAAVEMRQYQLHSEDVRLLTNYAADLPPVWADSLQLQQVFLNIINNAVQAVQNWRGSGEIRISTRPALINGSPAVRIAIEDNGPGIAAEHLRRIFDPFFTTKPTGQGTGLGMSIAQRIVSNHDGLIWAESRLGYGARIIVELPGGGAVNSVKEEADAADSGAMEPSYPRRHGQKVLVIDDEEPVVTLITEILMLDHHEVTPAYNGAEALALLRSNDYDLILSDVRMPAVGGPTFFEILQTTRPDLLPKVVFVTGDTMSPSTREFLQKTGRPVLAKPFDPERLRQMVEKCLNESAGS